MDGLQGRLEDDMTESICTRVTPASLPGLLERLGLKRLDYNPFKYYEERWVMHENGKTSLANSLTRPLIGEGAFTEHDNNEFVRLVSAACGKD